MRDEALRNTRKAKRMGWHGCCSLWSDHTGRLGMCC